MFIKNVTIGADIEVFLRDTASGEIVSAEGIVKGTKERPFFFDSKDEFSGTSLDNVMAEFTVKPAQTPAEFFHAVEKSLGYVRSSVHNLGLAPVAQPAARLSERFLKTKNAMLFGCDPDYNAWTEMMNPNPGERISDLRTCGGHIHIGYDAPSPYINVALIKAMDIFVGLPSLFQEPENERKTLYGKAGAFRHKKYGVEYRTLSNYYAGDQKLTEWVFENTMAAVEYTNSGRIFNLEYDICEDIVRAINTSDLGLAENLIQRFSVKMAA
ncbi:MAG TPA: hypothetical protein VGE06_00635 [Flavisolibacter sp.]